LFFYESLETKQKMKHVVFWFF